jgi:hypothetical protein
VRQRPDPREAGVEGLYAALLAAGAARPERCRQLLADFAPDVPTLLALLRRAVPAAFLEVLAATPPWSQDRRLLGAIARNPRAPRALALRLVPSLFWSDLAEVARNAWIHPAVRSRAEALLLEMLPELRPGERLALAKRATPALLQLLLADADPKVVRAALVNPRLREDDLLLAIRRDTAPRALLEEAAAGYRWREAYAVRLALVLQTRTPLAVALGQLTSLVARDLERVAGTPSLSPLVQAGAARVARRQARRRAGS